ncbi:sulfatase [uncultured Prevotella sp.]|uniref:sulfatase family protein n=1 Tax=uncultured Prevotella sp. TaxID=159272 RepID=UPI0026DCD6FD|nr:sulfatase [uncultured Prevotella sp.]
MDNKSLLSFAALSCVAATAQAQQKAAAATQRPNIVYIMCDDHAFQCISAYGSPISKLAPTPNIDRIAQRGMRFDRAFVENSLSTPSRACLMTGLYSNQNGQRQLGEGIDTTRTFFTEQLQQAGYQTAVVGKWHMGCDPKGFDYYHIYNDQGQYYNPQYRGTDTDGKYIVEEGYSTDLTTDHALSFIEHRDTNKPFCLLLHHKAPHRNWLANTKYFGMYDNVTFPMPETFYDDYETRGSAVRTQKMSVTKDMRWEQDFKVPEMLDTANADSWDSYLSLMNEVNRMNPEQRIAWGKYYFPRNRRLLEARLTGKELDEWKYQNYIRDYMSVIKSVDESVGRVLDYLDSHGLTDNTIIVYTSDQGFYMGEHGWFDKRFMYEESLRTPLLIAYPGHIQPGTVCNKLVQNIDYAPTFLDLAGISKQKELPGRSLTPLFKAGDKVKGWRNSIYYHYYDYPTYHMVRKHDGVRTDRYKLIHFYGAGGLDAVKENKYQRQPGTREHGCMTYLTSLGYFEPKDSAVNYNELYDLQADPHELNNLYGKPGYEKITKQLQKQLTDYRKSIGVDEY